MEKPLILHMLTTEGNISPFDANMAADAGWQHIIPYTLAETDHVQALVQDAIFSRPPSTARYTGIFIGGRDLFTALRMLDSARNSMVPPFEISCFADPSGAFTTAAGMIALVEKHLMRLDHGSLDGKRVMIMGGTGPVGVATGILASQAGADVCLISRSMKKAAEAVSRSRELAGSMNMRPGDSATKQTELPRVQIVLAAAAAGVRVIDEAELAAAPRLLVAADVNAVSPSGIAGLEVTYDGTPVAASVSHAVGIGALAIGNVKYQAQHRLLQEMYAGKKRVYLHFEHACDMARRYVREST